MKAPDAHTLQVKLTSPQPWFVQQVAHTSFLAVNKKAVEQFGDKWTEAKNIVTDGPFKLASWEHDSRIDLVKNADWRNASDVSLERVNGRMISDGTTAVQAFEAGEVDVTASLPPDEIPRLKDTPEYDKYAALGTYYYGLNIKNIPDVNAAPRDGARDRPADDHRQHRPGRPGPGDGLHAEGHAGLRHDQPELAVAAGLRRHRRRRRTLMSQVQSPKKSITLWYNEDPAHKEIAVAVQSHVEAARAST